MQARFGEGFFSIVTKKNYLLHPTSSGFESRATHMENRKDQSWFLTWTHFIYKIFGLVNLAMVYLKMQPYRMTAFGIRHSIKLASKFYGPFRVLECVGETAYKLLFPEKCKLHPIFHISQLKKHHGPLAIPTPILPLIDEHGNIFVPVV